MQCCWVVDGLGSAVQALLAIVRGSGTSFAAHVSADLRKLVFSCLYHANRFVRECGYLIAAEFCSICGVAGPLTWGSEVADVLPDGLSENWGQVGIPLLCTRNHLQARRAEVCTWHAGAPSSLPCGKGAAPGRQSQPKPALSKTSPRTLLQSMA